MNTITLVGYSLKNLDVYSRQLQNLFDNKLHISTLLIDNLQFIEFIQSDIVLLPTNDIIPLIHSKISATSKLVKYNRTLTLAGIQLLNSIKTHQKIHLVDQEKSMAQNLVHTCLKLGIRHLDLEPTDYTELTEKKPEILITYSTDTLQNDYNHYDIGEVLLDIDTIVEIALILNLESLLIDKDLKKAYKENKSTRYGLPILFDRLNKYESTVLILFDNIDYGYIELDLDRKLYYCNNNALRIFNLEKNAYKSTHIEKFIDQRLIDEVFRHKKYITDEIIQIQNESIILSIYPNLNAGKFFGATVIVNQFSDSEKKHNEIRNKIMLKGHKSKYTFDDIVGASSEIEDCKIQAMNISHSEAPVVIEGETGTGKELLAHAIHNKSSRKNYPFVTVNCGALPSEILESELFGHEEGAFTGAKKGGKIGLFEMAHKGTIFLDEIGEMPVHLQMKLLRVLQEKEIFKIGGDQVQHIDIRVISATNKNLETLVSEGLFREDLYYRLKVLPLYVPSLRDRNIDILMLHDYFKRELGGTYTLSDRAKSSLLSHHWKGNIRELRNYVEYFTCIHKDVIDETVIPFNSTPRPKLACDISCTFDKFLDVAGNDIEKYNKILKLFHECYFEKKRLGRRTILEELSSKDFFITEQEIRRIINELDDLAIISVGKGRKGSQITPFGLSFVKLLETENL